jgi:hypothetical protein
MAAPDYVPVPLSEQPRESLRLPPPRRWMADRPADLQRGQPVGPKLGRPGPDQGYLLKLADLFTDRVEVAEGEHAEDAIAGCAAVALRRAALFGRAPVALDLEMALRLWGFLGGAPDDLVQFRHRLFAGAAHHYWDQRTVTDLVPDEALRLTPAQVAERLSDWRQLLNV